MISQATGEGGLTLEERPVPKPDAGQLLLRMRAASLNYRDIDVVRGTHGRHAGLVPLSDGVGEVVDIGAKVSRFAVGDRVSPTFFPDWIDGQASVDSRTGSLGWPRPGVLSEYVVVDEHAAVRAPSNLNDVEAATLPCAAVTAWDALFVSGRVVPGDTVVVQGTGGVSLFALRFAKMAGARVIVTSGQRAKLDRALALGAAHGIDYRAEPDWDKAVLELTGGRGADHVVDVAGRTGHFDLGTSFVRKTTLHPLGVGSRRTFEALVRAIELHDVHPVIDAVFPLERAHEAFERLASGEVFGKVAISLV